MNKKTDREHLADLSPSERHLVESLRKLDDKAQQAITGLCKELLGQPDFLRTQPFKLPRVSMAVEPGVQRDWESQKWYFIIYDGAAAGRVHHRSEAIYLKMEQAEQGALEWRQEASSRKTQDQYR